MEDGFVGVRLSEVEHEAQMSVEIKLRTVKTPQEALCGQDQKCSSYLVALGSL